MLDKKHRLNLAKAENIAIFAPKAKKVYKSKFFLLFQRPNQDFLRLNCVVPKRLAKTAVLRNFYRRLFFQLLRELYQGDQFQELLKRPEDWLLLYRQLPVTLLSKGEDRQKIRQTLTTDLKQLFVQLS